VKTGKPVGWIKKINILEIFGEKIKSEKMSDKKMVWLQPATFATF
jgi:hypothetical protein